MTRIEVALLQHVVLDAPAELAFANDDRLPLEPGTYWTAAFGLVIDCTTQNLIATPSNGWRRPGTLRPRFTGPAS